MPPKSQTLRSEYDDKSIMHYGGSKEGCRNSKEPYMVLKSTGKAIPDNKELRRVFTLILLRSLCDWLTLARLVTSLAESTI